MTNYGCIAVGINQYQFVEPLHHAEADAQGLVKFLTEEMGVPREKCILLTESSLAVGDRPTYPNYSNISAWLEDISNSSTNPDWLWFLFSGHGVHWRGEDYLLPIDSNLSDLPYRAISATTLLQALKQQNNTNNTKILLLLDINRSPGLGMETPVGKQFSQLAQELEINLIQSVSDQECSYERKELGHGLFTSALGEALSYHRQDLTLQNLSQYLMVRLPELGNHHGIPQQHPLIQLANSADQQELLLPIKVNSNSPEQNSGQAILLNSSPGNNLGTPVRYRSGVEPPTESPRENPEPKKQNTKIQPESTVIQPPSTKIQPETTPAPGAKKIVKNSSKTGAKKRSKEESNAALPWILGAGLLFLLMVLGVFLRNLGVFFGTGQPEPIALPTSNPSLVTTNPAIPKANNSPQTPTSSSPIASPTPAISPSSSPNQPIPQPLTQPFTTAKDSPVVNDPRRQQTNQFVLENARGLLQSDRVAQFAQAIKVASQIPAGEPLYDQAQADINRWSIVIMDMAHGRAKAGDWAGAIVTAQTLPAVNQKIYKDAQIWIARWQEFIQQRDVNLQQIQKARRLLRPNQATTYRQAVDTIKSVPAGQPGYELAQELINTWTTEIWQIAQGRANNGDFLGAIAAANLLPENTPTSTQAQATINLWRQGKKSP